MTIKPSDLVGSHIQSARQRQGLTAQQLAANCAAIGAQHLTAAVIANMETGRRDASGLRRRDVTVDELLAIALALDVPPASLLGPHDRWAIVHVTSDIHAEPADIAAWVKGDSKAVVPSLLGGLALCGACRTAVRACGNAEGMSYFCANVNCSGPRVNRPGEGIDVYVTEVTIERLQRPDAIEAIYPDLLNGDKALDFNAEIERLDTEIDGLKQRRAEARKQLEELADHPHLSAEVIARTLTSFSQRIEQLEKDQRKMKRQALLLSTRTESLWEKLTLSNKRDVINILMTVTLVSEENANEREFAVGENFEPDYVQIGPPR